MESKLAEKLSALRVRAGLSQRDVAKRIGISTKQDAGLRISLFYIVFLSSIR